MATTEDVEVKGDDEVVVTAADAPVQVQDAPAEPCKLTAQMCNLVSNIQGKFT